MSLNQTELKSVFGENIKGEPNEIQMQQYQERQNKEQEERRKRELQKKQTGMKKELIKLLGMALPSIVETNENKLNKNKRTKWVYTPYTNNARTDGLKLIHWQKAEDVNKEIDYSQFNKKIDIVEFSESEYDSLIKPYDKNWNYEQTLYLWDLLKRFDLRFNVVYDRFDEETYGKRTVEGLKDRYYSVAKIILENRKIFDHPIIKSGYNYEQEIQRRTFMEREMNKKSEDQKAEEEFIRKVDIINAKIEEFNFVENILNKDMNDISLKLKEKEEYVMKNDDLDSLNKDKELLINDNNNILENNNNSNNIIKNINNSANTESNPQNFEEFIKENAGENDSFIYLRSKKIRYPLPVNEKIQKRVELYMKELSVPTNLISTQRVEYAYDTLRNNVLLYTTLKKYLDKKEKEIQFLGKTRDYIVQKMTAKSSNNAPAVNPQQLQTTSTQSQGQGRPCKERRKQALKMQENLGMPRKEKEHSEAHKKNNLQVELNILSNENIEKKPKELPNVPSVNINLNVKKEEDEKHAHKNEEKIEDKDANNNEKEFGSAAKPPRERKKKSANTTPRPKKRKHAGDNDEEQVQDEQKTASQMKKKKKK